MATVAILGQGVILVPAPRGDTSPFDFTAANAVKDVLSISGPSASAPEVKVTSHSSASGFDEFIAANRDPGEMQFDVNFNPAQNSHRDYDGLTASPDVPDGLAYMFRTGTKYEWQLSIPQAGSPLRKARFSAVMTGMNYSFPIDTQITATMTLRLSGPIVWS